VSDSRGPAPAGPVRVVVWFRSPNGDDAGILAGYRKMRDDLTGKPGLRGSELLRSAGDPNSFGVSSEWESARHFVAWQQEAGHDDDTAPMDQYLDRTRPGGRYADMYQIVDAG
jgi:heme oxygenase (mycobilin-producing)